MTSQSRNLRSGLAYTREPSPSDASDASCSSRCHLADVVSDKLGRLATDLEARTYLSQATVGRGATF